MTRHDGRRPDQLRELDLQPDFLEQPHGSILYAQGRTVVLCTATVEAGSSEYSAVIQPRPLPRSQRGTASSTVAVQRTTVRPCA